tara:strand:+ start:38 stop:436 length:399 start_codon:yes stop_codon:yes gene_type:complete
MNDEDLTFHGHTVGDDAHNTVPTDEVQPITDMFGSPIGTGYGGVGDCPEQYYKCLTEDALNTMMLDAGMEYDYVTETVQPAQGDAEAIIDFTKDLLFLDIDVILNMAVPLTIFAVYGLTIYAAIKWIQKRLR